jgi:hypothetical protein
LLDSPISTLTISKSLHDEFVRYTKSVSAAYREECPSPLRNTLVKAVRIILPFRLSVFLSLPHYILWLDDRRGFIAREDTRKEIVVFFPGTNNLADVITGLFIFPSYPFTI